MKGTMLILGGSQVHAQMIRKVQELGFNALVVDRDEGCIGAQIADFFEPVNTSNLEEATQVAKKYGIIGSLTTSSDVAVPTSCYVNETLNLPRQGHGIHHVVADKCLMKKCFFLGDVSSPAFYVVESEEQFRAVREIVEREITKTAFIVKPADSSGSRGVSKLEAFGDFQEMVEASRGFSRTGKVIVEEFIEGVKIGAETFSVNGEMRLCLVHNSTLSPGMINVGHSFPLSMPAQTVEVVTRQCEKALKSIGIENGPANFDLIIDRTGRPFVLEINARLAGTRLPELVKAYSGIDLLDMTVRIASGSHVPLSTGSTSMPVAVRVMHFESHGRIKSIHQHQHLLDKYQAIEFRLELEPGMQVVPFSAPAHQYGYVICEGTNAEQAERNCHHFLQELKGLIECYETGWEDGEAVI